MGYTKTATTNVIERTRMKKRIEQYLPILKKSAFRAFVILSIIVLIIVFAFPNYEFRTIGYKVRAYAFRMYVHIIPIWLAYFIYKLFHPSHKIRPIWRFIRIVLAILLIPLCIGEFMIGFFGSYADGSYERCMESCVTEDLSNFDECTFSICDFPI